jgi:hypothetical protein
LPSGAPRPLRRLHPDHAAQCSPVEVEVEAFQFQRGNGGGGEDEGRPSARVVADAGRLPPPRLRLVRLLRHLGAPRRRLLADGE